MRSPAIGATGAAVRAELGVGDEEIVVGTVANFRQAKRYDLLIEAAQIVVDRLPSVRFVAVGQGPLEDKVRAWHKASGLGDRFLLTGYRADARRVMSAFDLFTLGSEHEGLPVAVMEALALGLPVVATAVGGLPEAVDDGVEGRLVPPLRPDLLADAIIACGRGPGPPGTDVRRRVGPRPGLQRRRRGPSARSHLSRGDAMCGIAGVLDRTASTPGDELAAAAAAMARTLAYRGPDGEATWVDEASGVALGHRRLAVVDLSEAAAQPMTSACGRYVISFNGEIYNFGPLRQELAAAGHRFRGTGDTETLLAAISAWSYPVALERAEGMFAFALWDREERVLHLARDRMGEKPLYYGRFGSTVLFGSELKALRAHRAFRADIDRDAVADLLALKYVPAPRSIFQNVKKLPPATTLAIPAGSTGDLPEPVSYWTLPETTSEPTLTRGELVDQAESLLAASIRARMIADVPVGAFLSGGIDSSAVVALMQRVGAPGAHVHRRVR